MIKVAGFASAGGLSHSPPDVLVCCLSFSNLPTIHPTETVDAENTSSQMMLMSSSMSTVTALFQDVTQRHINNGVLVVGKNYIAAETAAANYFFHISPKCSSYTA